MPNTDVTPGPAARLDRFRTAVRELGVRAALISDPRHVFYVTGFLSAGRSPVFLLLPADDAPLLVAGESEAGRAGSVQAVEVAPYGDVSMPRPILPPQAAARAVAEAVRRCGLTWEGPVGIEEHHLPAYAVASLEDCERVDIAPVLRAMRLCKDADEQDRIRRSVAVTGAGYAAAREATVPGATEMQVYAATQRACVLEAGEPIGFDGDFVSGERSLEMGGPPTDRVMRDGDLLICDLFPTVAGYWADTCRTFAVGRASPAQRDLHQLVGSALERGRWAVRPGVRACEVYQEMRAYLASAGHGERFPHHGGHGIGLEAHESPWIIPGDDTELRAGMVITLEPGVYLEGVGGVRLEDNFIVTADGAQVLAPYPLGLEAAQGDDAERRAAMAGRREVQ